MSVTLSEVLAVVERLWPHAGAEEWDAPGLISGDPAAPVARISLAVDAVAATVDDAIASGCDLLLVHHPLLMRGVTSIAEDRAKGAMLARLIRANCALVAAHTNADVVESGTSAAFAAALRLQNPSPITSTNGTTGLGRVGMLAEPTTLGRLARAIADILPPTASGVRVAGSYETPVHSVALCGGAGDSLLGDPAVTAADVYITSDLRHHPASEARENARVSGGPALIDVSHWASEWLWLATAARELADALPGVDVSVSDIRTDPWDFVVIQ